MTKRDYYEVLGVGKTASPDEVKKAFRRKAVEHHPDKEGGNEEKFKEINEAYEVLKDPSKRQRYDQFGHAGVGTSAASDAGGFSGFGGQGQGVNFDFGDLGLGDIFESFFGGGFGGQGNRARQARGRDVETNVEISFEQAVFGTEVDLHLSLEDNCTHCKGTTVEPGHELKSCDRCGGSGQIMNMTRTIFGDIQQATSCPKCNGRGKIPEKVCSVCHGSGTQRRQQTITLKVPAGIDDGATIRLREHGEAVANGPKGDLYVNVRVKSHKKFTREGDLILSEEKIGMVEAALGTEIEVDTVDGPVRMKIPAGTQSKTDFKLSGHGVPHFKSNSRGSHIVTITVETPSRLSKLDDMKGATSGYVVAVAGALIQAWVLVHFVQYAKAATFSDGLQVGFWLWLGFVGVTSAVNSVFAGRSWKLWKIDAGYFLVVLLINSALLAVWS